MLKLISSIGLAVALADLKRRIRHWARSGILGAVGALFAVIALCFFLGLFGELLDVPGWLMDVSPFSHIPEVPAADLTPAPVIVLTLIAAALAAAGLAAFRRRDLATD